VNWKQFLRAKSFTIADALCIAYREEGAGEAGGGFTGANLGTKKTIISLKERYLSDVRIAKNRGTF
jgi:hypothetical protein